jgi:hypothetical protein
MCATGFPSGRSPSYPACGAANCLYFISRDLGLGR